MNPPFTRSVGGNLLFGNLKKAERLKLQAGLKELVQKEGLSADITAGLGSVFVALGDRLVKRGGHLALVLPRAVLSGVAWEPTRKLIGALYNLRYIVVSHEAGKWSLSENTKLSECLLIAQRKAGSDAPAATKVVNLWRRAENAVEALGFAQGILKAEGVPLEGSVATSELLVGNAKIAEIVTAPVDRVREGDWSAECAFAQTELGRAARYLHAGKVYVPGRGVVGAIVTKPLNQLGGVGPDVRDIHDGFSVAGSPTAYAAIWGHETGTVSTMWRSVNGYLAPLAKPKPGRPYRDANLLWSRAGRIVIVERMRLNLVRVVASALTLRFSPTPGGRSKSTRTFRRLIESRRRSLCGLTRRWVY